MRNEDEVKLKQAYWNGTFDTLNTPENAKSGKFNDERITALTWLAALDWMLGQGGAGAKLDGPEEIKH
jgi:hypothetical protein